MNPLVDWSPTLRLLAMAALVAVVPLAWVWLRARGTTPERRLALLTALTLFLTFDLIVFGAFTRLTDSGLGCPDWPGCYGHASPIGAAAPIADAASAMPSGPVTPAKAWIEMIHRYLAMTVGALCLVMALASWRARERLAHSPWWATATLVWVIVQGLFGKYTVTWKLYPAIVTLHLIGGLVLLALLARQREAFAPRALPAARALRGGVALALAVVAVQVVLGGWVSTNYAVLACRGFPTCNGAWWPASMNARDGFAVLRELGHTADGRLLPFDALVAIHWVHRLFALVVTAVVGWLVWRLWRSRDAAAQRWARLLLAVLLAQWATGLSNVVLNWPIVAALAHSAGAAALVGLLTVLWLRAREAAAVPHARPGARSRLRVHGARG